MESSKKRWSHAEHFVRQTDRDELIPAALALAEDLDNDEVWLLNRNLRDGSQASGVLDSAMANLELTFCTNRLHRQRAALGRAANLFAKVTESNHEKARQNANIMLDFMPLFETRMKKEPYNSDALAQVYRRLGARAVTVALETPNFFYETLLFTASLRIRDPDYLILPASVREEAASTRRKNYNHDGYILRDLKIPIQAKSIPSSDSKKYMPGIHMVFVRKIMTQAAAEIYGESGFTMYGAENSSDEDSDKSVRSTLRLDLGQLMQHTAKVFLADSQGITVSGLDSAYLQGIQNLLCERIDVCYSKQQAGEWPKAGVSPKMQSYVREITG